MELHTPSYYPKFRCLADRCPHTCCGYWEVPVDKASGEFYRTVPGLLGERLRIALVPDGEGGECFRLAGGTCPFLNGGGLCSLQLKWGEEKTPAICQKHPRFDYDYGPVREVGLCASCPEAARLILENELVLHTEGRPEGEGDELLSPLLLGRETALALLRADAPLTHRLRAVLLLGNDLQSALDEGAPQVFEEICASYREGLPVLEGVTLPDRRESLQTVLTCLEGLELLRPQWGDLLRAAKAKPATGDLPLSPETEGGRAAAYFLYRHWLRALNDGDLLSWCELAVVGTAVAGALAPLEPEGFPETFRLFCLEVEHSQPNLDALQDALWHTLTLADLLALA